MLHLILFLFFGALCVAGAVNVLAHSHPINSALSLIVVMASLAGEYLLLGAEFVAAIQVIVYAGAIMVLFLFVIWLLNLQTEESGQTGQLALKLFGSIGAALLVTELVLLLAPPHLQVKFSQHPAGYGSIGRLAGTMFTSYLVAFEVTSVLLLAAVVGSVALARRLPAVQNQAAAGKTAA